jgi:hypothetical protein
MNKSIDISEWINQQRISGLQILVICLRGACALVEGNIGYVAPAVIREWGLPAQALPRARRK